MVYLQHRRFLPENHPLRKNHSGFPDKKIVRNSPAPKDMEYFHKQGLKLQKAKTEKALRSAVKRGGFKGEYALGQLNYHDRYLDTPVEPMHLLKNIVEHIVHLVSGVEDSSKVRAEERSRGRFLDACRVNTKGKLPPAPFRLTKAEAKTASDRAVSVQVPIGFGWSLHHFLLALQQ